MNRHIIIGFEKGASYKRDLGDVIGIAGSRKEAKAKALKAMGVKGSKVVYCTVHNGKIPVAKVGGKSEKPVVVTIASAKAKAQAKK